MRTTRILVVALIAGLAGLVTTVTRAADAKDDGTPALKAEQIVSGLVTVTKDGEKVKQITIGEGDAMVCVCTANDEGKKVAALDGKKVKATGTVEEKGGKKVIKVTKVEELVWKAL